MFDAFDYLNSLNHLGSVPGLECIKELLKKLNNPEKNLKVIHIAGTNGKGSVGAFIDSVLVTAGYKTGRYSSPAVIDQYEIIRFCEENITPKEFNCVVEKTALAADNMDPHPTRFEIETAAAFLYMQEKKVDFAIIECGMGGRLDATNVFDKTLCSVITSISLDHTAFLGDTIDKIAYEKAGIIKTDSCVITSNANSNILEIIKTEATNKNSVFIHTCEAENIYFENNKIIFDYDIYKNIEIGLVGYYQIENAGLAVSVLKYLVEMGYEISLSQLKYGMKNTKWPGRFEKISEEPLFIVDGAHNPNGAKGLRDSLEAFFEDKKFTFLIGIFKDKDIYGILDEVMKFCDNAVVIETPNNHRAAKGTYIQSILQDKYNCGAFVCNSVEEGVRKSIEICKSFGIISLGSLSNIKTIKEEVAQFANWK